MSKPRRQPCTLQGCNIWVRHGWTSRKGFFCSVVCRMLAHGQDPKRRPS